MFGAPHLQQLVQAAQPRAHQAAVVLSPGLALDLDAVAAVALGGVRSVLEFGGHACVECPC